MTIYDKIKAQRKKRGITQAKMASMLGVSQARYSQIECGKASVGMDTITRVIELLGLKLEIK